MKYADLEWRDGQPYSPEFDDIYFSADKGVEETEHVFIQHNQLQQRFANNADFVIVETGFGSGLNFLVAAQHWLDLNHSSNCLYFYSIENTPFSLDDLIQAQTFWPEYKEIAAELHNQYQVASYGFHLFNLFNGRIKLVLMIGDVETQLPQLQTKVDAWFLDGFAPSLNPKMWNELVISHIRRLSEQDTTFSTYTAVGDIRRGLMNAGFNVEKVTGCGNKRHMLKGVFKTEQAKKIISDQPLLNFPWFENKSIKPVDKTACIIGAGIAGVSTAWCLVQRGFKVTLIEAADEIGAGASGNPAGMLMPRLSLQDSSDAEFYNSAYFFALRCLKKIDKNQIGWKQTGGIQLSSSDRVKKQNSNYQQDKMLMKILNSTSASNVSGLNIDEAAQYFSQAAMVIPKKILHILMDDMGESVTLKTNCHVSDIKYKNSKWYLLDDKSTTITTTPCLIVASAWQATNFDVLNYLPLQPARGQIDEVKSNKKVAKLKMPISFGGYIIPEVKDKHVVGASFKLDDCDVHVRESETKANIDDVNRWWPEFFNQHDVVSSRASIRAVTPDRTPIVGAVPKKVQFDMDYNDLHKGKRAHTYPMGSYWPNLYVNTGHGARGFCSAFLSAEMLTATICDEPLPVSGRVRYALHSARFLIRSYKKKK